MSNYSEEDFLQLSGLQHFVFCPRQWALIHVEKQWSENLRTTEGKLLHENAHNTDFRERKKNVVIVRGLAIFSRKLGLSGQCDVVEFHKKADGVELQGEKGTWLPFPVEYKRGHPKEHLADEIQLCAQAMCLEEMLCCDIPAGALFYGEPRRRTPVEFTPKLREIVVAASEEMHRYASRGYTPKCKQSKSCVACSLKEVCLPQLQRKGKVSDYINMSLEEDQ